ncbi:MULTISPECIES: nonribosomal peptide synthetase MxaA [unclassified Xanthobacter]|uniref:nonribosomal peptide synthetase MxaA n=1 Tax=unclassified Xanthobacter TaxID=2623496 RepID=UPI001EDE7855|nr:MULTISPECIES: nonribosomal peptide synthetase MxaA [unclassified Xanthobacter]
MRCSIFSCIASRLGRSIAAGARRGLPRLAGAGIALLALTAGPVQADSVTLLPARAFGYFLGDLVRVEADIRLDPGFALVPAALPQPHKVNGYLDLIRVDLSPGPLTADGSSYRLTMVYQNFYGALEPRAMEIPAVPLRATNGEAPRDLLVPAFVFTAAPFRELVPSRGGNPMALRPDILPRPYPLRPEIEAITVAALVGTLALLALALLQGWRPFTRSQRPFATALRALAPLAAAPTDVPAYRAGLITLHRAFDAAAGHRLLADDVAAWCRHDPRYSDLSSEIAGFFTTSRRAFFGAEPAAAMEALPTADLLALARRLAHAERRDPRPRPPAAALAAEGAP